MLRANRKQIGAHVDTFRSFTVGGRAHLTVPTDRFYAYVSDGQRLRDWVARIAAGQPVSSVDCTDCWRAQYRLVEQDARIVERALELVSPAGAWVPRDLGDACPESTARLTLRCSVRKAVAEVTGLTVTTQVPAVVWDIHYAIIDRIGDRDWLFGGPPLVVYNNRPGTTVADVIGLLEAVRDRIRADLHERARQ